MINIHSDYVCIAVVTSAYGIKGQVKVKSFAASEEFLLALNQVFSESGQCYEVLFKPLQKGVFVANFTHSNDRNAAEALRGQKLYIQAELLPQLEEDEFYIKDLVGLEARNSQKEVIGTVVGVYNFGAGDILEIERNLGEKPLREMVLFSKENVPEISLKDKYVILNEVNYLG